MSTPEITPDLLHRVSDAWEGNTASDDYARHELHQWANGLERPTPGQTLWEAEASITTKKWVEVDLQLRSRYECIAATVLAAHGTPTMTDEDRSEAFHRGWLAGNDSAKPASLVLTPVGKRPEPGTRGLLPVVLESGSWHTIYGAFLCHVDSAIGSIILADPRPGGAQ